jgi:Fe2+ transport system protein FeoA
MDKPLLKLLIEDTLQRIFHCAYHNYRPAIQIETESRENLSQLKPGESARVVSISPRSQGAERRRFLDLGILPGTLITAEMVSPSGDPTAYHIRGAMIGLRQEQARLIHITRGKETASGSNSFEPTNTLECDSP